MSCLKRWGLLLCATALTTVQADDTALFTEQERAWIQAHPVVSYTTDHFVLAGQVEHGGHAGLTRDYLDHIARMSGLSFKLQPTTDWQHTLAQLSAGTLDLTSSVSSRLLGDDEQTMALSDAYFVDSTLVVTGSSEAMVFSPGKLEGKRLALLKGGYSQRYLARHYPQIELLPVGSADEALAAVAAGKADAAMGMSSVMQPLMRRQYPDQLFVSGILTDLPVVLAIGVTPHAPELLSIINKSLGTLTSRDTDQMVDRWLARIDFGAPTWRAVLQHYHRVLAGLALALLLIVLFARRARQAQRNAQRSADDKSRFMAVMSHEIRTPMNAILASIELLARTSLGHRQRALNDLASSSARNLLELLDSVLDATKLDHKAMKLDRRPCNIALLAQSVADIHRLAAEAKGVEVNFDPGELTGVTLAADTLRMRQVLSNLMSNAVTFTAQGSVTLRLRAVNTGDPQLTLQISVADTGIGMTQQQQLRAFTAFAQAEDSITRQYGGTGLGLAICKQLVELMEGQITLRSTPGQGTEVVATLPMARCEAQPSAVQAPRARTAAVPGLRVLVVEDHPVNQQMLRLQLGELEYECVVMDEGPTALQCLARGERFAAVLLDCYLPIMDGYEVARRIRAMEREQALPRLPIIAISAASDDRHRQRCQDSGIDVILGKPLNLVMLSETLARWIQVAPAPLPSVPGPLHDLFLTACHDDLRQLDAALARQDSLSAAHHAHRILGAALMTGAGQVAACAGSLEERLREPNGVTPDTCALHQALQDCVQ